MSDQVDPALSAKRSAAGRRGAEARWAKAKRAEPAKSWREGLEAFRNQKPKDAPSWRVENAAGDDDTAAEMYIYDEIDAFWGVSARDVTQALMGITASRITLHLNSPGGDVFEAHAIYNALRAHKAEVDVIVDGIAASAASYVAQAGDTVRMQSNATMMIHDAIGLTYGNAADHLEMVGLLDKQSDIIAGIYADRAGGTVEEWRDEMRAERWYNADEAVEAGLATEVIDRDVVTDAADTKVYGDAARLVAATKTPEPGPGAAAVAQSDPDPLDGIDVSDLSELLKGAFA